MTCLDDFRRITVGDATVFHGSNLDVLPLMADNSVDSIVTDPPYELGFMGKKWDSTGIAYSVELWRECLRVLKPGGHLLAFGGSRTWHRLAVAIEDAGFEIRDSVAWLYGSGFPKSHNISKTIDRMAGAEREVIGSRPLTGNGKTMKSGFHQPDGSGAGETVKQEVFEFTAPATDDAKKWEGWGTALKPAFEPVVVARKPLIGTVAENVLTWGVGGLNIDASRIGFADEKDIAEYDFNNNGQNRSTKSEGDSLDVHEGGWKVQKGEKSVPSGRWPANVILGHTEECQPVGERSERVGGGAKGSSGFAAGYSGEGWQGKEISTTVWECVDGCPVRLLDEQSGFSKSTGIINRWKDGAKPFGGGAGHEFESIQGVADSGGASRFFYVSKASKRDRNEGLDELPNQLKQTQMRSANGTGDKNFEGGFNDTIQKNIHPTVKPTDLMRYLIKLVTPDGGLVLDPFTGSGSTGKAALLDGFRFIGIELTEDYLPIIEGRLVWADKQKQEEVAKSQAKEKETLF